MIKNYFSKVTAFAVAFLFVAVSCVNEEICISEETLDDKVTVFSEGFVLPVGSLDTIRIQEALKKAEGVDTLLSLLDGGAYALNIADKFDLSDSLNAMLDELVFEPFTYESPVAFSLESVNVDDVKVDEMWYPESGEPYEVLISELVQAPELPKIDNIDKSYYEAAGIWEYAPDEEQLKLPFDEPIEKSSNIISISDELVIPEYLLSDDEIPLDGDLLNGMVSFTDEYKVSESFTVDISLPKGITSVNDIMLHENAAMKITAELVDPFLKEGYITPDIDIDLHEILHLEEGDIAHLQNDFVLSHENDFHVEKTYGISSLAIEKDDWEVKEDGTCALKDPEFIITMDGNVQTSDLTTTTNLINENRDVLLKVSLEFIDFEIADVEVEIEPVVISKEESVPVQLAETELPEAIESIEKVIFDENSSIDIILAPDNLSKLTGLGVTIDECIVTFPEGMVVEDTDEQNRIVIQGEDVSNGYSKQIRVKEFLLPDPVDGKISYDEEINVTATISAAGSVNTADLPTDEANDVKFNVSVKGQLEIADYQAKIAGYDHPLSDFETQKIDIELTDEFADLGTITVYPECPDGNEPVITMEIEMPEFPEGSDLELAPMASDEQTGVRGIRISFPKMLHFKDIPASYNYDEATHSINFYEELPETVALTVDKLVITPELSEEDQKWHCTGELKVEGGVSLSAGTATKADVDAITAPDTKISFLAHVPEMKAATVGIDTYTTSITQEIDFSFMDAGSLPEQLVSVGRVELNEVYVNFEVDASSLPNRDDVDLDLNVNVAFPDIIVIEDERVDENGVLNVSGALNEDGIISVEPIRIDALDLTGYDLAAGIAGKITVDGNITLSNAMLDTEAWLGKAHEVNVNAGIEHIAIDKINARVDYQVDPIATTVDLSGVSSMLKTDNLQATLDLNKFYIMLDLATNLSIPINLALDVTPYYDGAPGEGLQVDLDVQTATSVDEVSNTRFWISNTDTDMAAGYEFVELDIMSLLRNIPDSLALSVVGGTDPEQDAVIGLSEPFVLEANYNAALPLELGEEFEVVYRDTIANLDALIAQVFACGDLAVQGEFTNSLPLAIAVEFNLLDKEGKVIELDETSGSMIIPSRSLDGTPTTCDLNISFIKKEGVDISGLSAIEIVATANSGDAYGQPVRATDFVTGKISVSLPSGMTADISDLIEQFGGSEENDDEE